jgi:hypothetical protein
MLLRFIRTFDRVGASYNREGRTSRLTKKCSHKSLSVYIPSEIMGSCPGVILTRVLLTEYVCNVRRSWALELL